MRGLCAGGLPRHPGSRREEILSFCKDIMSWDETDAAEAMRQRLQSDLRSAIKARAVRDVTVLRQLIAAIDNAGAVPLPPKAQQVSSEVERRSLRFDDIQALRHATCSCDLQL